MIHIPSMIAGASPLGFSLAAAILSTLALAAPCRGDELLQPRPAIEVAVVPFLQTYCADCHGTEYAESEVDVDALLQADSVHEHRRKWTRIAERIEQADMPPEDAPQPTAAEREVVAEWLRQELAAIDCSPPLNPGRVTLRRLNRAEYANTVADWIGAAIDPSELLPQDELGYGFDNIGDVLSMSPLLLEKYLDAAEQIAESAIVAPETLVAPAATR
ncbi:MAG: DUF1587 domain-containing protein, partial [Planctomycetota bacterium]